MKMLKTVSNISEVEYILKNLRPEDKEELENLYGDDWFNCSIKLLNDKETLVLYGYDYNNNQVPIAIGGFYETDKNNPYIACAWLLSTIYIYKNKTLFLKEAKKQITKAESKYRIMYNYIYKTNKLAKKWLQRFNFRFDKPSPAGIKVSEGFEFFYKIT